MAGMRCPYAILTACSQSHAFEERQITIPCSEEEALKIGRSVARSKPSSDNAIFDCKVLSRNHAILWYEDGCFFLKDTKSSNGTFVNNDRLSKSAEESSPRQIFSGDIVQFGVEIVENANKVAHGCIVAMLRLYDANGDEVCAPELSDQVGCLGCCESKLLPLLLGPSITSHQLFQLQQYVREATHRERVLEQKLTSLENVLLLTQQSAETSWQALINEDRLLSRIEMLESQLSLYVKSSVTDKVKSDMNELYVDKNKFEALAKESLRRAQEEKCEALQRLADAECSLLNTEEEALMLKQRASDLENELAIAEDVNINLKENILQLQEQLKAAEGKYESVLARNIELNNILGKNDADKKLDGVGLCENRGLLNNGGTVSQTLDEFPSDKSNADDRLNSTEGVVPIGGESEFTALLFCALPLLFLLIVAFRIRSIASTL